MAGIVAVGVILISFYFVFRGPEPGLGTKATPPPAGKTQTKTEPPDKNALYLANPANRESFHAFLRFMDWAGAYGASLNGDDLTSKYRADVSQANVDDPEVLQIHALLLQSFQINPAHPFQRPPLDLSNAPGGSARLSDGQSAQAWKKTNDQIKGLRLSLCKRYGDLK